MMKTGYLKVNSFSRKEVAMKFRILMLLTLAATMLISVACNPEDEYLRQLYPKESRTYAIQELKKMKDEIVNLDKTCEKMLKLDKTPQAGMAVLAAGELGCTMSIDRIGEIVDECLNSINARNLKTLESAAMALGLLKQPSSVPMLAKYFTIKTPERLAEGMREKQESVAKRAAIEALSKMPEASKHLVPEVLKVFDSKIEDFGTKYTTAGVLGNWQDPSTVRPLVTSLFYEEKGFSLFPEARESLIKLGKLAEAELLKAYSGQNPAVNKLQDANKDRATKKFCPEYLNEDVKKKGECPKHGEWEATLASIDTTKKLKTSIILADIRSKQAVDVVISELEAQLSTSEKQPFLTEHLAVQLAKFGDFKATDTLLKMVSSKYTKSQAKKKGRLTPEEKKQLKLSNKGQEVSILMKGAEALAILGDPKAIPYLMELALKEPLSEYNMMNEKIIFYEANVWAADAFTRMTSDPEQAGKFIAHAKKFIAEGEKYVAKVEARVKKEVLSQKKDIDEKELEKNVKAQSQLDVNYSSTGRAVTMFKRFLKRAKLAQKCGKELKCYADSLKSKVPEDVEKAVYMLGYSGDMGHYKEQLKPVFVHKEPWVREAVAVALLKTEDKGFLPIIEDTISKEGDKVEYAGAIKEYKAIRSYLSSIK